MSNIDNLLIVKNDIKDAIINKNGVINGGLVTYADSILGLKKSYTKITDGTKFAYSMFTTPPNIDTSDITDASYLFMDCRFLTSIPELDTSNVTNMEGMFWGCENLVTIPHLDTSKVTSMKSMFAGSDQLATIPQLDTSNVTNMEAMFAQCGNLRYLPLLDLSGIGSPLTNMFYGCLLLEHLGGFINLSSNIDLSSSFELTTESLLNVFNYAANVDNKTMRLGSILLNKLTDEQKMIAINKGWTLT